MPNLCGRRDDGTFLWLSLVLVLGLLLLFFSAPAVYPQSLPKPNDPWMTLKVSIDSLPQAISSYNSSLTTQLNELQKTNSSLMDSVNRLEANNLALTQLLQTSRQQAATSTAALSRLQSDLISSTASITQAQNQARVLEAQGKLLKIGLVSALAVIAGVGVYSGGRAAHFW